MADYATATEVKAYAPDLNWGATYDTLFGYLVTAISRLIDRYMRREDSAYDASDTATIRYFDGKGEAEQFIDECVEITKVEYLSAESTWTEWAATDYMKLGPDGSKNQTPYCTLYVENYGDYSLFPEGKQNLRITAKWGYSATVPNLVKLACVEHAIYSFKQLQQAMQDMGGMTELGIIARVPPLCGPAISLLDQMPKKAR